MLTRFGADEKSPEVGNKTLLHSETRLEEDVISESYRTYRTLPSSGVISAAADVERSPACSLKFSAFNRLHRHPTS